MLPTSCPRSPPERRKLRSARPAQRPGNWFPVAAVPLSLFSFLHALPTVSICRVVNTSMYVDCTTSRPLMLPPSRRESIVAYSSAYPDVDEDTQRGPLAKSHRKGHEYRVLETLKGADRRRLEPALVTLTEASDVFPLFQHPGGPASSSSTCSPAKIVYGHGAYEYSMEPGGSPLMDGESPHGPLELLGLPIRLLALAAKQDFMGVLHDVGRLLRTELVGRRMGLPAHPALPSLNARRAKVDLHPQPDVRHHLEQPSSGELGAGTVDAWGRHRPWLGPTG